MQKQMITKYFVKYVFFLLILGLKFAFSTKGTYPTLLFFYSFKYWLGQKKVQLKNAYPIFITFMIFIIGRCTVYNRNCLVNI